MQYGSAVTDAPTLPSVEEVNAMVRTSFPGSEVECVEIGTGYALARRQVTPADIRPGVEFPVHLPSRANPDPAPVPDAPDPLLVRWYGTVRSYGPLACGQTV